MKLLVSDYDGTLKSDVKNFKLNIQAIIEFMQQGNLFCLATSRSYRLIKSEIDKYDIPYNYLMCNNGCTIFDDKNNLIFSKNININTIRTFYNLIKKYNYKFDMFNAYGFECFNTVAFIDIFHDKLFRDRQLENYLSHFIPDIYMYNMDGHLYLQSKMDKAMGIDIILNLTNFDIENIYTVGSSINDIKMLQMFNGYKMFFCNPCLYNEGIKTCSEVHKLIKKIMK